MGALGRHGVVRGDVDSRFGTGMVTRVTEALMRLDASSGGRHSEIMEAFQTQRFIPTKNDNYAAIEEVARGLGIIQD